MIDFQQVASLLKSRDRYEILIHSYPDGDTIGCGFALCRALRSVGKQANVSCSQEIPESYSYITGMEKQDFVPETVITVDVATLPMLGEGYEHYEGKVWLSIDHHAGRVDFAEHSFVDGTSASACELIFETIRALGAEVTPTIAACLYTGIATDTGCFKYANTTPRTHRMAAELMETGIDAARINRLMFENKSRRRIEIERMALDSMRFYEDGKIAVITITREMLKKTGAGQNDLEGITPLPRQVEGVYIGITMRQIESGAFKISLRTQEPVDASAICALFGGGGHVRASGCTMDLPADVCLEKLLAACKGPLRDIR